MVARPFNQCRCGGTGIVADDGSVTDMVGWPLPCPCTDSVPFRIRSLMAATTHPGRSASHEVPCPSPSAVSMLSR